VSAAPLKATDASRKAAPDGPREAAPGVYWLAVGKGLLRANVYFVRSGASWVLIDAGAEGCAPEVQKAAESLFGQDSPPAALLLTHDHPDHAGSAAELARTWNCPVWVHPDELPIVRGDIATFREYAHPLDRWIILPILRLMSKKRIEAIVSRGSLKDVARALDPGAAPPGLPDWEAVPTPGHTPGHVAFFRRQDRVLMTGDALVTVNISSIRGLLVKKPGLSGPPWYVTWDRPLAKKAISTLAELEPLVVASGHGEPLSGPDLPEKVRALAAGR
jgi:glyoxylase-like metal-dependent hydrolase (beta-lactamase superfamily II)